MTVKSLLTLVVVAINNFRLTIWPPAFTIYSVARDRNEYVYGLIGQRIRKLRNDRELPPDELARQCGLKRPSVVLIEQGKQKIPIDRLYLVAQALQCNSISELLPDLQDAFPQLGLDGELPFPLDEGSERRLEESAGGTKEAVDAVIAAAVKKIQKKRRTK